jgi:hypothetical protein
MKRFEIHARQWAKVCNFVTKVASIENMQITRQYWVHPVQVRSLELVATMEYHLYGRILVPLVRSCIPEMRSIAFQRP